MKIKINYDFMYQVYAVNGKFKLQRKMVEKKEIGMISYGMVMLMTLLTEPKADIELIRSLTLGLLSHTLVSINYAIIDDRKDYIKALYNLKDLATKINDNFGFGSKLNTSDELLKYSEQYASSYKLNYEKGKIFITQKKYIHIPTYNDGIVEYDKLSVVQEHDINIFPPSLNDEYILTVGSPDKKLKLAYTLS